MVPPLVNGHVMQLHQRIANLSRYVKMLDVLIPRTDNQKDERDFLRNQMVATHTHAYGCVRSHENL